MKGFREMDDFKLVWGCDGKGVWVDGQGEGNEGCY